jgi:MFS family permease
MTKSNTPRGLTNSFSIFESHYTSLFSNLSHSTLSWPGSLQLFLTLFIGAFAGRYLDAGYLRPVVATGIALEVLGMLATSFCKQFWQLVLAQGVVVGVGSGMLAFTSASVVPFWWGRWRMGIAGVVSTGSSVGKFITTHLIDCRW